MIVEKRSHQRAPIECPLGFFIKGKKSDAIDGVGKDIAIGGMFIDTSDPAPFGADIIIHIKLPGANDVVVLPAVVRWIRDGGMGVQFGLLGAIETHLITEINRKHADADAG